METYETHFCSNQIGQLPWRSSFAYCQNKWKNGRCAYRVSSREVSRAKSMLSGRKKGFSQGLCWLSESTIALSPSLADPIDVQASPCCLSITDSHHYLFTGLLS